VSETFPLREETPWRWALRLIGVRRGRSQVELTSDDRLVATFGPLVLDTTLGNVADVHLTGPYRWWRAIGPRGSLADRGFTFGTSATDGACLCFRTGVPRRWVLGGRVTSLTVTVASPEDFAATLARRGIPVDDRRRR
jgi:hypothetical protein